MARMTAAPRKAASTSRAPPFRAVQLATLVDTVPTGNRWLHEMKYDGYRVLLSVGGGEAVAYTRSGLDWSEKFSGLVADALKLKVSSALIDGEAVVLDADGRSSFQALQNALKGAPASIDYFAFDLLELDGEDLTQLPLTERKAKLAKILPKGKSRLRYSDHIAGNGEKLLNQFCAAGLEGVISKRADGRYAGSRSGGWLKTKCIKRQEFVVVGWTPSDKSRLFRSLILGVHDDGVLRYAGKVGTGFDTQEIIDLMAVMAPLEQEAPTVNAPRAEVRGAHWLRPKLVAEIAFTEMTNEGTLRHPSFLGLREDKKPEAVVVETEAPVEAVTAETSSIKITNRDRVIFPEGSSPRVSWPIIMRRSPRSCCPGSVRGRSASCAARKAGPRNASSRSMTRAVLATLSGMSPFARRTGTTSPISMSIPRTACSHAYRWARSSSMVGAPGSRMSRRPTGWSSILIPTRAWISRMCAALPSTFARSCSRSGSRPSRW
jgi:bifunctional non-homologous end joining protein LigD